MSNASVPRYLAIGEELMAQITSGKYAVGDSLPTEAQLCEQYKISRYTAREALRVIENQGLIVRRQGSGSKVTGRPTRRYIVPSDWDAEVLQYGGGSYLDFSDTSLIKIGLTGLMRHDLDPSVEWVRFDGVRREADGAVLAVSHFVIREDLADTVRRLPRKCVEPVSSILAAEYGFQLTHIDQEIYAARLPAAVSRILEVASGDPGLVIARLYRDENDEIFELAVSHHRASEFRYSTRLAVEGATPARGGRARTRSG